MIQQILIICTKGKNPGKTNKSCRGNNAVFENIRAHYEFHGRGMLLCAFAVWLNFQKNYRCTTLI